MKEYLIITDHKTIEGRVYPIVFMAIKTENGYKRILDLEKYVKDGQGVSEVEETYPDGVDIHVIKRTAKVTVSVKMP